MKHQSGIVSGMFPTAARHKFSKGGKGEGHRLHTWYTTQWNDHVKELVKSAAAQTSAVHRWRRWNLSVVWNWWIIRAPCGLW